MAKKYDPKDFVPKKGEPFDLDKDFATGKDENPYRRTQTKKKQKKKKKT
jgi:hypothetical protein